MCGEPLQPRLLQRDVVIRVEVVGAGDRIPSGKEPLHDVHADESRRAGDDDVPLCTRGGAHRFASAVCSARSFAYFMKLLWHPIAMCTNPATPSRKPSFTT